MRTLRSTLAFLATILIMATAIPAAFAVDTPSLGDVISPVDANKATVSGTTEPGYKVIVTGGPYQISPVYADTNGNFEVTVALVQESTNTFSIKIEDSEGNASETVQVVIIESAAEAAEAEESGSGDHTAPDAPLLDDIPETIDADTYTFTGTGEPNATIMLSDGSQEKSIGSSGAFSFTLDLEQGASNTFKFMVKDSAGNLSSSTSVTLEEISVITVEGEEEEEEEEEEAEEENIVEISTTDDEGGTTVIFLSDIYGHWAQDYITELVSLGIVEGYDDGTFLPNNPVNRAEFLKMVMGALAFDVPDSVSETAFTDVPADSWYAPYIQTAYEQGIVEGYDNGTFGPGSEINRAEAVKILLGAAGIEVHPDISLFPDVSIDDWFGPYVSMASSLGLIGGYDNGNFGPGDPMTRAQVCKVIVELLDQL